MDRKYSLEEIDRMRKDVATLCAHNGGYDPKEQIVKIEERLRTYMANGTEPEELSAAARKHFDGLLAAQRYASERGLTIA